MISTYCDTENWTPLLDKVLKDSPHLNAIDAHISINCLSYDKTKKYNILLLQESPAFLGSRGILQQIVKHSAEIKKMYHKVYTCIHLFQHYDFVEYIHPSNISWIHTPKLLPNKTKIISMITSNKSFLQGHQKRLQILNQVKDFVDVYGRGFNEIRDKAQGLDDYYFSIAIENDDTNDYFSEKLLDCFMTSTIPIYYGSDCVYKFFNPAGIIDIKKYDDVKDLKKLDRHWYINNIDAVIDNYYIAQKHNRYADSSFNIILSKLYYENLR